MTEYQTLKTLVDKFKEIKSSKSAQELSMNDYDIFKRYTTSKRDHGPQLRLNSNMRKRWPIVMNVDNCIPEVWNKVQLKPDNRTDIGEISLCRTSIHTVDYLSKYGAECDLSVAKALISTETEKVERFFATTFTKLIYGRFFPYRKQQKVSPTVEDVSQSAVNPTITVALMPNYVTPEYFKVANYEAVKKLKEKLSPLLHLRTTMNIVHQARMLIQSSIKWIPTIVENNPRTSELVHFTCSQYHLLIIPKKEDMSIVSYERLFQDLIREALNESNPKALLMKALNEILIFDLPLREVLPEVRGGKPFTQIAKAVLNIPTSHYTYVRHTKFEVLSSDGKLMKERSVFGMVGALQYFFNWTWWKGTEIIFFENDIIKGYIKKVDRTIEQVSLNNMANGTYVKEVLLDILYYCRAVQTGFDKDYPTFISEKQRKKYFFDYHRMNMNEYFSAYGVHSKGVVSNDGFYLQDSKGYLEKVVMCLTTVQPYEIKQFETVVSSRLVVSIKKNGLLYEILNPLDLEFDSNYPFPSGLDFNTLTDFNIYQNRLVKFSKVAEQMLTNTHRLKRGIEELGYGIYSDQPVSKRLKGLFSASKHSNGAMKRLRDEDWSDLERSPKRRVDAFYYMCMAANPAPSGANKPNIPSTMTLAGSSQVFQQSGRKGMITYDDNTLKVVGTEILKKDLGPRHDYQVISIHESPKYGYYCKSLEEGFRLKLNKFCYKARGLYYYIAKKQTLHTESENVTRALSRASEYVERSNVYSYITGPEEF